MSQTQLCPAIDRLELMILGRLSDEESQQLEQHLLDCPECQWQTRELAKADTLVDAIRKQAAQPVEVVANQSLKAAIEQLRDRSLIAKNSSLERTRISGEGSEVGSEADYTELLLVLRPAEAADEIGRLDGFRLLKLLGHGGMGAVFLAEDLRLKRRVALTEEARSAWESMRVPSRSKITSE